MTMHDNRLEAAAHAAGIVIGEGRQIPRRYVRSLRPYSEDRPPKIPDPLPPVWAAGPGAKLLLDLELGDCRFPVGEGTGVAQLFCADDAHGQPDGYCPACARRVLRTGADVNPALVAA